MSQPSMILSGVSMFNLQKNAKITFQLFRLNLLQLIEYKENFIFDTILRFLEFAVFFFFWKGIFNAQGTIPGWDMVSLLIMYGYLQIFVSLYLSVAVGVHTLDKAISRGEIDKYLSRPVQPWLIIIGEGAFLAVGGFINGFGALLIAQFALGANVFSPLFPVLLLMTVIAVLITTSFGLIMGTLGFWFGRIRLYDEITTAFWEFDSFPLTLFPISIQTISSFILPFLFASNVPALATVGLLSVETTFMYLGLELIILLISVSIFYMLWKKGVRYYESYGG